MSGRFARHVQGVRGEEILKAALKQFCARGAVVRTEDVSTAVGIGKGTLYRHYHSRATLLHAAVEYGIGVLERRTLAVRKAAADAPDLGFHAVLRELAMMNRRNDPVSPAMLTRLFCCERWPEPLGAPPDPAHALRPAIRIWQEAGFFNPAEDSDLIATSMFALCAFDAIGGGGGARRTGGRRATTAVDDAAARIGMVLRRAFPSRRSNGGSVDGAASEATNAYGG